MSIVKVYPVGKISHFYLQVDKLHKIYVEESGNKEGVPVISLHGGPGAPMGKGFYKTWDPKKFRIITFHQRGCGKSTPRNSLVRNTTKYQFKDIEAIRKHLKINKWVVEGGSWGASLAVLYSIHYPKRVLQLNILGLSLFDRILEGSTKVGAPDVYYKWLGNAKSDLSMMKVYFKNLTSKNKTTQYKWAKKWNIESKLFEIMDFPSWKLRKGKKLKKLKKLKKSQKSKKSKKSKEDDLTLALLECYYYMNGAFFPKDYMLKHAHKLKNIPGYIIHGRFDLICNPEGSYKLSQRWKKAKLMLTDLAGHSMGNRNNMKAILEANNSCKRFYKSRKSFYGK